jgi:H/ACA ribonucleoprotein complex subunit 4
MPALQGLDKEYIGVMHLHNDATLENLKNIVKKFTGEIKQRPPVRSAVKRRERKRKVYSFEILEKKGKDVAFRISCQAGTYVRMVCHDIGKKTGGAHMTELRRVRVGRFGEENVVKMEELIDSYSEWKSGKSEKIRNYILPVEATVEHLGKIIIKDSAVHSIVNGSPLYCQGISKLEKSIKKDDLLAVLTLKGELIALARSNLDSKEMSGKKLAAKIDRVIMEKGVYPKTK